MLPATGILQAESAWKLALCVLLQLFSNVYHVLCRSVVKPPGFDDQSRKFTLKYLFTTNDEIARPISDFDVGDAAYESIYAEPAGKHFMGWLFD